MTPTDSGNRLFWVQTDEFSDPELYRRAYELLSAERQERVDAHRFASDRRLSLGAGLLLRAGLRRYGITAPQLCAGEHGKPCLADRETPQFNLSHSGSIAVLALSERPVGVDVERCRTFQDALLRRVFSPEELQNAPETAPERYYTQLWTVKESVMKHFGTGLMLDPRKIRILPDRPITVSCEGYDCTSLRFTTGQIEDCMLCVCSEAAPFPTEFEQLSVPSLLAT